MGTLARLFVSLGFDNSELRTGAAEAKTTIRSVESEANRATESAAGSLDKVGRSGSGVGGILKGALSTAIGFGGAQLAMMGVSTGLGAIKGAAIDMNASMETSTLQFTTLMGNADQAKTHVADLFKFAKDTPFETEPVIQASRYMRTFGGAALDTKENLTLFGNAAAATSAPINDVGFWMSRMYANIQGGQPFGEAAMRMQELGIMTPQMVQALEKAQKSGASSSEVWKMATGDLDRFGGAMKAQAGTWTGLTSSLVDAVNITMAQAFKPFFDGAKASAGALLDFVSNPAVTNAISGFSSLMAGAFGFVSGILKDVLVGAFNLAKGAITPFAEIIGGMISDIQHGTDIISAISNAVFDFATQLGFTSGEASGAYTWVKQIAGVLMGEVYTAFDTVRWVIDSLVHGWHAFTGSLQAGVSPLVAVANGVASFLHFMGLGGDQIQGVTDKFTGFGGAVTDGVGSIKDVVTKDFLPILGAVVGMWSAVLAGGLSLVKNLVPEIQRLGRIVFDHLQPVADMFSHKILPAWKGFWDFVSPFIIQFLALIQKNIPLVVDIITSAFSIAVTIIGKVLDLIVFQITVAVNTISWIWDHFGSYIKIIIGTAFNVVKDTIQGALNIVQGVFKFFSDLFKGNWGALWGDAVNILKSIFGAIGSILGDILSGAMAIVKNIIIDVLNWIISRLNDLIHGVNWLTGKIPGIGGDLHVPDIPGIITDTSAGKVAAGGLGTKKFHQGGMVPGYPGQEVPIIAKAGEIVTVAGAVHTPGASERGGSGKEVSVVQHFHQSMVQPGQVSRELRWALKTA